ncbi:MAG: hypothetical protein O4803_04765 [Trichodesmium sp. St15_bin1_1]|nr:hypothetical protein [Trichodesmium sp. St16_bin2-tuft]MDE5113595.1 hypothetical protein [Trichodesmium sp. St15_bin1_1]
MTCLLRKNYFWPITKVYIWISGCKLRDVNNKCLSCNSAGQIDTLAFLGQTMSLTEDGKKTSATAINLIGKTT